jgi:hypothetical protein
MSLIFATQLTAVGTVVLAVLALAAAVVAWLALRKQSRELAIVVKENNRQAIERRRAQAAKVFIGVYPDPPRLVAPQAENASDFPIFDAQFWYSGPGNSLRPPDDLGQIMPKLGKPGTPRFSPDEALARTILTFRDTDSVRWIRMPDGTFDQQSRPTPLESVRAALEKTPYAPPAGPRQVPFAGPG